MKTKLPTFETEEQERDFWSSHDSTEYVDWDQAQQVSMPHLKPSVQTLSIQLPEPILDGMTKKWTDEIEQRFTELRLRKLTDDSLTEAEQKELAELIAMVEIVEFDTTATALKKLETEQIALQSVLGKYKNENKELIELFNQQALLIVDSKRWLAEFEQRYAIIQNSFTRLTAHSLAT
jgi:hypothetical protein